MAICPSIPRPCTQTVKPDRKKYGLTRGDLLQHFSDTPPLLQGFDSLLLRVKITPKQHTACDGQNVPN